MLNNNVLREFLHCLPSLGLQVWCVCMCDSRDTEMTYFVICINYSIIIKASLGQHPVTRAPTHSMGCCNKVEPNKTGERFVFFFSSFVSSWYPLLSVSKASSHSSNYAFNQSFNCTATQLINQLETQSVRQSDNHTYRSICISSPLYSSDDLTVLALRNVQEEENVKMWIVKLSCFPPFKA